MHIGGPQRSLLNLLPEFDKTKYRVTLKLFNKSGALLNELPQDISVVSIEPAALFEPVCLKSIKSILSIIPRIVIRSLMIFSKTIYRNNKNWHWLIMSLFIKRDKTHYDVAIAYMEGISIYYLVDKINSKIKIGRMPTDYGAAKQLNKHWDYNYFKKLYKVFVVSPKTREVFITVFPDFKNKVEVFYSIVSKKNIQKQALNGQTYSDQFDGIRILTISRLHVAKGIGIAIESCKILRSKGYNIRWYVLGDGQNTYFNNLIKSLELEEVFVLLKPTPNPYGYLNNCDIYVQPSFLEGRSNAVNEAKALAKPIVLTNFPTAKEHIQENITGLIAEMSPTSLSEKLITLIENPSMRQHLSNNLNKTEFANDDVVQKITTLI